MPNLDLLFEFDKVKLPISDSQKFETNENENYILDWNILCDLLLAWKGTKTVICSGSKVRLVVSSEFS